MIAMLCGEIEYIDRSQIVVMVNGVGFEVFIAKQLLVNARVNSSIKLYTYHLIREDDEKLFGFASREEHDLFVRFLSVDGVGPKVAMAIFSTYAFDQICEGLARGDERFFAAVSGLGKKTAAKIVIDLKGTVVSDTLAVGDNRKANTDVVDALVALGFAERDIFGVVQDLDASMSPDMQIKAALKKLSSH